MSGAPTRSLPDAAKEDRTPLSGLLPEEIADALSLKPYQGRQLFHWIQAKRHFDFESMTDLSKSLRVRLSADYVACRLNLAKMDASGQTGTRKALLTLPDGETVESVLIPARDKMTLCLSTQVGCAVKCAFCATGLSGFARDLTRGEIVEQALYLLAQNDPGERSPNIVFMGMGEPFRNYDETVGAIRILLHPEGLNIGARRITVSTVGEVPAIRRFAEEDWQVRLSVSLHAANDDLRNELVPLNRRYNISSLMEAVDEYISITGRQVTFEWTLLAGVNDSIEHAQELSKLVRGLKCSVNLIPYNPVSGTDFQKPDRQVCESFRVALEREGVQATLRLERGQDIDAACGQLRRKTAPAES